MLEAITWAHNQEQYKNKNNLQQHCSRVNKTKETKEQQQ